MTAYARTDYGRNPLAGASRNNAASRGWGPGWPNAQEGKMITVLGGGVRVRVRREIAPLVETLLNATAKLGYTLKPGACWGFANRPIRGTQTASNHSWGLAVDLNAEDNPMGSTFRTDIPPAVVRAWEACGFYWGGRYANRPDSMHFEYVRRPGDVPEDLTRAAGMLSAAALGDVKPTKTEDDDMTLEEFEGYMARLFNTKGSVGAWRVQDRAWQQAVLNESKAQTAALKAIADALTKKL